MTTEKQKRIGRQTPTKSYVIPYEHTKGQEAINIYEKSGRKAREWQKLLIYDILAYDENELWKHSTYCYAVPRRNGKTEDVIMRILYGLFKGEKIIYTSHLISTSHSVWETITYLLDCMEVNYMSVKAKGQENIRLIDEEGKPYKLNHMINFRTRSSNGGLGEGYDTLIIDEAQEYTIDQESALKYTISASSNPQIIMLGTPPTAISHGTVFQKLREKVFEGSSKNIGWSEWSVSSMHDPKDIDAWYECNPSLGQGLTERVIENEDTTDDVDFNIQRLGYWLTYSASSCITKKEWESLALEENYIPKFKGKLYVGIKFGVNNQNVAMSIATKVEDKTYIECYDCVPARNNHMWIIDFLKNADVAKIVIDGQGSQTILASEMKDFSVKKKPVLPTVKDVIIAYKLFEQGILTDKDILHNNQKSVIQVITNCVHRNIGTNGGFGFQSVIDEYEIAIVESMALAYWLCKTSKEKKTKSKISY